MRKVGLLTLLVLVVALLTASIAAAQAPVTTNQRASTSAEVTAQGSPPVVQFAFVLPDMQPNVPGIQYDVNTPCAAVHQHDWDMATALAQVRPNIWDRPLENLEFWAIVSSPFGPGDITGAYVDVFHPNGSRKYEIPLIRVVQSEAQGALGAVNACGWPLEAAIHTGQITAAQGATIYTNVGFGKNWIVFRGIGTISKDQPYGRYTAFAIATGTTGATSARTNFVFDVLPVMALAIDFTQVNYGLIMPGVAQNVAGDRIFELNAAGTAGDASAWPTVMNIGNVYLNLNVRFSPLVGATLQKVIDRYFDVTLGTQNEGPFPTQALTIPTRRLPIQPPVNINGLIADTNYVVPGYVLESDIPVQIDFSLIATNASNPGAPLSLPQDVYSGNVTLWGSASTVQNPVGIPGPTPSGTTAPVNAG